MRRGGADPRLVRVGRRRGWAASERTWCINSASSIGEQLARVPMLAQEAAQPPAVVDDEVPSTTVRPDRERPAHAAAASMRSQKVRLATARRLSPSRSDVRETTISPSKTHARPVPVPRQLDLVHASNPDRRGVADTVRDRRLGYPAPERGGGLWLSASPSRRSLFARSVDAARPSTTGGRGSPGLSNHPRK